VKRRSSLTVTIEACDAGFRYRVTKGGRLLGASGLYQGFDEAMYAMQSRFPSHGAVKVTTQDG
jgi:hypothetical protein